MVSNIDETKPVTGIDQPAKVMRDNFTIAKIEITELQARKFESDGSSIMTGPLELVSFTLAELPPAIDNEGNLVYVSDSSPPSPFYSDGLIWRPTGFSDIVNDTTPQLGGDLDVNGFSIVSVSNGDIPITPDGAGSVVLDGLDWPQADGTNGQALVTDGAGNLSFVTILGGGLFNVVEDTTPQLGGDLDAQSTRKIINLVDPTLAQDAATKKYVDDEIFAAAGLINIVEDTTPQLGGQLDAQNFRIINLGDPVNGNDATNKTYVDSVASGLDPKESVRVATTADLGFTFADNGGVGDTLTAGAPGTTVIDTITLADGDRVLVKDESDAKQNGIYVASATDGGSTTILTRATDQDGSPSNEVSAGNFTFVETGAINASTGWVVVGDGVLTINVDDVDWAQFSDVSGALVNIVDDTTPQIGGDLDVNGFDIVSISNGDIAITPNGSGSVILDGLDWPQSDGSNGQVLTTDGGGNLSFTTIISGGLNNIVEDLTPQLGADLDNNGFAIRTDGSIVLSFASSGEEAENWIDIEHAQTGSGPIVRSVGSDTDVDLLLQPKGVGEVQVGLDTANAVITAADAAVSSGLAGRTLTVSAGSGDGVGDGGNVLITPGTAPGAGDDGIVIVGLNGDSEIRGDINSNLTIGGGDSDSNADAGGTTIISGNGSSSFASGDITITPGIGGASDGNLILDGLTWPVVDGTTGQALTTDGAGNLGFATVGAGSLSNIVEDTTPQLGGDLDINGNSIVSVSNGDIAITPNGSGSVVLDGLNWPQSDGSNGEVLTTDGGGNLSFAAGGGSAFTTQIASSTPIAAVDDDEILVDTVALAVTVNLPGSPTLGDRVRIVDGAGNASTNNITVGRNGEVIMGIAADFVINVDNAGGEFVFMNVANGWRLVNNV